MTDLEEFRQDGIESVDEGDECVADDVDKEQYTFTVKGSVCNVKLDNCDLSGIVNGFPGDPISLRPFDRYFTRANIWKWWCNVGFMPMTRNALNDEKVGSQWDLRANILMLKLTKRGTEKLLQMQRSWWQK